jgi:hypothetical protein
MQNKKVSSTICAVVIVLLLAGLVFFIMQTVRAGAMEKVLTSKLVSTVVMFGKIQNVSSDGNITLSYNGDTAVIKINSNAKMLTMAGGAQKQVSLQDLKAGDFVNVSLKINANYTIEGVQVILLPSFLPASAK